MSESKSNKENADLLASMNAKVEGSGKKFTNVQKMDNGSYQLTLSMDSQSAAPFLVKEHVKSVVRTKDSNNSLLGKIRFNEEAEALRRKMEIAYMKDFIKNPKEAARLEIQYRDQLGPGYLDLRESSPDETEAVKLYDRSEKEYLRTGIYGTTLDLLSNFAASGFFNDINDKEIKEFFDAWVGDVRFLEIVTKIFHSLFKYNVAYVLPAFGAYEPHAEGISSIPGKLPNNKTKVGLKASVAYTLNDFVKKTTGKGMNFKNFNQIYDMEIAKGGEFPIAYSLLDPKFISVDSAGFFNRSTITIKKKGLQPLKDLMKRIEEDSKNVSASEKEVLKLIPSGMRAAAQNDEDYTFKDGEVEVIYLRKDDYESYAKPRGARAFDAFDYKDELKKADYATVDGIYNYILKVTVGDKDNPVTDPAVLESLAEAFNTPQKAFTIVWNHTLQIEKITASEIGDVLGKAKYEPVEADITAALGFARALVDGTSITGDAAVLATKSLQSEINAARLQVMGWIMPQYRKLAMAAGFQTYPTIRWKESVINTDTDAVTRASLMQMLDRKAISVQSYMREVNLDFETEVQRMTEEKPLIEDDILRAGSPYQEPVPVAGDTGRPKGQPAGKKAPVNKTKVVKRALQPKSPSQASEDDSESTSFLVELIQELNKFDPSTKAKIVESLAGEKKVLDADVAVEQPDLDEETQRLQETSTDSIDSGTDLEDETSNLPIDEQDSFDEASIKDILEDDSQ